jgi:uncharacterized membrane protein
VPRTIVALFDNTTQAAVAVQDLVNAGFEADDISVVSQNERGDASVSTAGEATAVGVGTGALLGGLGGLLVGLGVLALPGIGPVLAAGPLASALAGAGLGAAAGGVIGALGELGVPEDEAHYYAEGVRRGGALVVVHTDDDRAERAVNVMSRLDPIDVEERAAEWRQRGWSRFDPEAPPYTTEDLLRERSGRASTGEPSGAVGRPVSEPGVYGGMRNREGRGVQAYASASRAARRGQSAVAGAGYDAYPADVDADHRRDFQSHYAAGGRPYEQYSPAYRFGHDLATHPRYRSVEWAALEPQARRQWDEIEPGTWDDKRHAIRYAWERARVRRAA